MSPNRTSSQRKSVPLSKKKKATAPKKKRVVRQTRASRGSARDEVTTTELSPLTTVSQLSIVGVDRSSQRTSTRELSWSEFDQAVQQLAREAQRKLKPEAVVGIAHGGVFVGGAIASALKVEFFPVRITQRSRDVGARSEQHMNTEMPSELRKRRVLIVDDVAGSGDGLELAVRMAKAAGAVKTRTAALVSRPSKYKPDFSAFSTDTFFVFPWDYQSVVEDARFDPDAAGA